MDELFSLVIVRMDSTRRKALCIKLLKSIGKIERGEREKGES